MSPFTRRRDELEQAASTAADEQRRRLAAERELETLRAAFDAVPVGLVLADRTGRVVLRNAAGRPGGHADVLVEEEIADKLRAAGQGARSERRLELYGPPQKVLLIRGVPLGGSGSLVVIDDLSERVRLDAVRTDFVANVSHELKTPVGALAVLADAMSDEDDLGTVHSLAGRMVAEAERASRTIDDLLELSRIELGGHAEDEEVSLRRIIDEAVDRTSIAAERRSIVIVVEIHDLPRLRGDARQLASAVANLLDNAVKYSPEGSEVHVRCASTADRVEIAVIDRGIGIPARDLDRIFERFYRVDRARSRETGGTGLGLAIVRHVATNHGGDVTVTSREGEGTTFTLRLPTSED